MDFIFYILSQPSGLFIIAVIFTLLSGATVYLWMKPKVNLEQKLMDENKVLRDSRDVILGKIKDCEETIKEYEQRFKKE